MRHLDPPDASDGRDMEAKDYSGLYSNATLVSHLNRLEKSFAIVNEQRLFWKLVNTSLSQREPYHRWARYREAYSGALVKELIRRSDVEPSRDFVFDPMCGSGSTLVASSQIGFDCLGSDVIPYSTDLTNAKLAHYTSEAIDEIQTLANSSNLPSLQRMLTSWKTMDDCRRYFKQQNLEELRLIRDAIETVPNQMAKQLLFVAWLTILEDCSERSKEGNGLATRNSKVKDVWLHFTSKVKMFLDDIYEEPMQEVLTAYAKKASAFEAHSLIEEFRRQTGKKLGVVIFSPPYANSFDYFESYKLELLAGYYDSRSLIEARKGAIRNYRKGYGYQLNSDDELVRLLCEEVTARIPEKEARIARVDNRSRLVPNLLIGYFEDMERVLRVLSESMPNSSQCHIVVNQSAYLGVIIPTDLVLANTATRHGFEVTRLTYCGKANTSSQQLKEYPYLRTLLRESIVSLRKNSTNAR